MIEPHEPELDVLDNGMLSAESVIEVRNRWADATDRRCLIGDCGAAVVPGFPYCRRHLGR